MASVTTTPAADGVANATKAWDRATRAWSRDDGLNAEKTGSLGEAMLHTGIDLICAHEELIDELVAALSGARLTIRAWHGPNQWEIYDRASPEMKAINSAIAKASPAPKREEAS